MEIYSKIKEKWLPIVAILDTGTDDNWISQDLVDRLGLNIKNGQQISAVDFSGQTINSTKIVHATWLSINSRQTRHTGFYVTRDAPIDLLFGKSFIFTEGIYSFNKSALVLVKQKPSESISPVSIPHKHPPFFGTPTLCS